MFRNVRYYQFDSGWPKSEELLSEALESAHFKPCGPLTERSSGWVPVHADAGDTLARRVNAADLFKLRSQSRVLPPAAVNEELDVRIEDYQARMGEAPSGREKRRLKAEARDELMPKALLKFHRTADGNKTALEEQLTEAALSASDKKSCRLRASYLSSYK